MNRDLTRIKDIEDSSIKIYMADLLRKGLVQSKLIEVCILIPSQFGLEVLDLSCETLPAGKADIHRRRNRRLGEEPHCEARSHLTSELLT